MIQLTKAEEQIMQILWSKEEGTVQAIRDGFDNCKPARTTIATMLNILESKGFAAHKLSGRANVYYPIIAKDKYSKSQLSGIINKYFNNSFASMVSFFAKENNLSIEQLDALIKETKEELRNENGK